MKLFDLMYLNGLNLNRIKQIVPLVQTYVYHEGAFTRDSIRVLKENGFTLGCSTDVCKNILTFNNRYYFSRKETDIPTIDELKAYVDANILSGGHNVM